MLPSESLSGPTPRVGYVLKVYPRFSETFVVTEILSREAAGEDLAIFALRPTTDARFHSEIARVAAPVTHLPKPVKLTDAWAVLRQARALIPELDHRLPEILPLMARLDPPEAIQGIHLALSATEQGITHLHAHFGSMAARVARVASAIADIPFSVTTHAKDLFHQSVDPVRLRSLVADASYVATVSAFNVSYLRVIAPVHAEKIRLVPNAIEVDRFAYRRPERVAGPLRVTAVGRLVEKKGFRVLLDAFAELRREGIEAELTLAGDGELAGELRDRVSALGLERVVRMPGPLPQSDVTNLLRDSDLFVAPCIIGADGNADGLPTVLLEAMATGVPCISTRVTGIPEVVIDGETGQLCPPGDSAALRAAIRRVATGDVDTVALAEAARALVEARHDARHQAAAHARFTDEARSAADRTAPRELVA